MHRKILITGANGFVARHLIDALRNGGDETIGVDVAQKPAWMPDHYLQCDLSDAVTTQTLLSDVRPDVIVHLAAISSVSQSWHDPERTLRLNIGMFLNIVGAVRLCGIKTRILSVGSSEEYGDVPECELPIKEERVPSPMNPYAVARFAQEEMSIFYQRHFGQDIVLTRSFNQIGPGQRETFVVPSFVRQIVDGKTTGEDPVCIHTGDLSIVRDFTDVRDAVSAYLLLIEKGVTGEIYNVCSGIGRTLDDALGVIARTAGVSVETQIDTSRIRPADNKAIVGDNSKLRALGWSPQYSFEDTLRDMLAEAERKSAGK